MPIIGTHMLFYTPQAEALRAMLRDAFGFRAVDAGHGWLIFALPPAELGVHPVEGHSSGGGAQHQITFMCDHIEGTMTQLRGKGVQFEGELRRQDWGSQVMMILPGDLKVMLYEPRHPTAIKAAPPKQRAAAMRARSKAPRSKRR